jgi:hypothetical protein
VIKIFRPKSKILLQIKKYPLKNVIYLSLKIFTYQFYQTHFFNKTKVLFCINISIKKEFHSQNEINSFNIHFYKILFRK